MTLIAIETCACCMHEAHDDTDCRQCSNPVDYAPDESALVKELRDDIKALVSYVWDRTDIADRAKSREQSRQIAHLCGKYEYGRDY